MNLEEIGYDIKTGRELIFISERYFRPCEVDELLGDASKAVLQLILLGWKRKYDFKKLVEEMVELDC